MERYLCKQCGAPAEANKDGIIRSCEHTGTVLLDMSVTCHGEGGVKDHSRLRKLVDAIIALLHWRKP